MSKVRMNIVEAVDAAMAANAEDISGIKDALREELRDALIAFGIARADQIARRNDITNAIEIRAGTPSAQEQHTLDGITQRITDLQNHADTAIAGRFGIGEMEANTLTSAVVIHPKNRHSMGFAELSADLKLPNPPSVKYHLPGGKK